MENEKDYKMVGFKLPMELVEILRARGKLHDRTLSAEVRHRLKRSLESDMDVAAGNTQIDPAIMEQSR